jgi:putative transposase
MVIEINSTWTVKEVPGIESGNYRILSLLHSISSLIIFNIPSKNEINRPKLISINDFEVAINEKQIQPIDLTLPHYTLVDDNSISDTHKKTRDTRYGKIKELIEDDMLLFELVTKKNSTKVSKHARKLAIDNKSIYRLLNLYWSNSQTVNGLLPAYNQSGAKGKIRKNVKRSLGTKPLSRTGSFERPPSYIVKESDFVFFIKALKKDHLKVNGLNLKETYYNLLRTSYKNIIIDNVTGIPSVPSYRQFVSWSKKLINETDTIILKTSENDYLRNKRSVEAALTDKTPIPGSCFEIDATVADVHIVSEYRRNHVIGRPTIYSVIDRASRMIVGFHVSLFYASWDAAKQALVNSFTPKKDYCKKYNIEIKESDWPCAHIPQRLICDNGEMIGLKSEQLVAPLTELQIAAPYRPDFKGIVENRFDYVNRKSLHRLFGSSRGGKIVRGSPDPRKSAVYTLKEVTTILLRDVLEHNKEIFEDLATSSLLLIKNDLDPSPINFWNVHIETHKHSLKTARIEEINARLLPKVEVSITRSGVLFNGMYYSCEQIRDSDLSSIARVNGRIKLEGRVDLEDTSYIYVYLSDSDGYVRCDVLDRSRELKNSTVADVLFIHDWVDNKKRKNPITKSSIENHKQKEKTQKNAVKLSKQAIPLTTKGERIADVKQRRQQEKELLEAQEQLSVPLPQNSVEEEPKRNYRKVIKLPRRNK